MDNGYEVVINSYIPLGCSSHWLASAHVGHLAHMGLMSPLVPKLCAPLERGRSYHHWMAPRSCDARVIVRLCHVIVRPWGKQPVVQDWCF